MDTYTHLTLVNREECEICGKDPYNKDFKEPVPAEEVVKTLLKMNKASGMSAQTLRAWVYLREGNLMHLSPKARNMWKWMLKMSERINCDWSEVLNLYNDSLPNHHKVKMNETQQSKDAKQEFADMLSEREDQDEQN